eukprot:jgi/Botrbrau1/17481/Bobra.0054s0066.1
MPVLSMQLHVSKEQTVVKDCSWRGTNLRPVCLLTGYATAHNLLQCNPPFSPIANKKKGLSLMFPIVHNVQHICTPYSQLYNILVPGSAIQQPVKIACHPGNCQLLINMR